MGMSDERHRPFREPENEVYVCPTRDEATAVAVADSEDGDHVITHQPDCECNPEGVGCTCIPDVTIVRRGEA